MKWLIASDLHGSATCTALLMKRFEESGAARLLLLGDILYHGPRNALPEGYNPPAVADMLNAIAARVCCLRGNCDSEVDQMVLRFPLTADYLYLPVGGHVCFATHGHVYSETRLPPLAEGDVFLYGHTHVPRCETLNGVTFMNPGSVSIPKGGSGRGYMTLDNGVFRWYTLDGRPCSAYTVPD